MPRTLTVAGGSARGTTTTLKLAERMLAASRVAKEGLPRGFHSPTPLNLLLEIYIAEEDARYLRLSELGATDEMHPRVAERWIAALVEEGLIAVRIDHAALTTKGHETVSLLLEAVFAAQRALD